MSNVYLGTIQGGPGRTNGGRTGASDGNRVQTGTVTTKVPARLDRLPWSRWHFTTADAGAAAHTAPQTAH